MQITETYVDASQDCFRILTCHAQKTAALLKIWTFSSVLYSFTFYLFFTASFARNLINLIKALFEWNKYALHIYVLKYICMCWLSSKLVLHMTKLSIYLIFKYKKNNNTKLLHAQDLFLINITAKHSKLTKHLYKFFFSKI